MEPKMEQPKQYTPEEIAKLEKSRTISDAELLEGGVEDVVDEKESKVDSMDFYYIQEDLKSMADILDHILRTSKSDLHSKVLGMQRPGVTDILEGAYSKKIHILKVHLEKEGKDQRLIEALDLVRRDIERCERIVLNILEDDEPVKLDSIGAITAFKQDLKKDIEIMKLIELNALVN